MPYAALIRKLAPILTAEALHALKIESPEVVEQIGKPGTLVDVAGHVVGLEEYEKDYLRAVPTALREALRATVASAIADEKEVQVQYSPGYEFEVRVWDSGQSIGVHLSGPYPPTFPSAGFVDESAD
jgi:hypothetical protein